MSESLSLPIRLAALGIGVAVWLLQYFLINNIETPRRQRFRPSTALDALIPFVPGFILVYLTTYLFGILPALMISDRALFIRLGVTYGVITLVAAVIHVAFPSSIVRVDVSGERGLSHRLIACFQHFAKPYGNFPSIHVAFSVLTVFTGFMVAGAPVGVLFFVWALLIALSTLVVKQHYVLDVVAGGALGGGVTAIVFLLP